MGTAEVNGDLWGASAQDWAELHEHVHRPLYDHVFASVRLAAGSSYCDVGCGSGLAIQMAAELGAKTAGLDASAALIAIARLRTADADLRIGEIEELPFADRAFELTTGFNAFQYAASPVQAIREAARVTRHGGYVVIATWSPPQLTEAAAILAALKPLLPPPPPNASAAAGPFALSEEAALRELTAQASLEPIATHDVECPFTYPDLATGVRALNASGVATRAIKHSGVEAVSAAHTEVLRRFRRDGRDDAPVRVPNRFRYLLTKVR